MKSKIYSALLMITAIIAATACTSDMEYKDISVAPVKQLYSPNDGKTIELIASATASAFFEWAPANVQDGNAPLYEIMFDKPDGDFTKPIYTMTSDNNGTRTYATISHKDLDKIAALAGYGSGETGTLKWSVMATRGISQAAALESRTVKVTRLLGFAEMPTELYITGEGTEGGSDASKAVACSSPESGAFEIFTKLVAGKNYCFVDGKSAPARAFYIDGTAIKETTSGTPVATVAETGIYRINLDFNIASCVMAKVVSFGFFFSPSNKVTIPLEYTGNGTWTGTGDTPFKQEGWGRDQRYKFEMVTEKDGTLTTTHWGPVNASLDSAPSEGQDASYYYMKEWNKTQWDNKWKLQDKYDTEKNSGKQTTFTVTINANGPYTHKVETAK